MKLLQSNKSNVELKSKLDELFEINNAEFKKFKSMYSKDRNAYITTIFDRLDYEDKLVENYKKIKLGENYAKTG